MRTFVLLLSGALMAASASAQGTDSHSGLGRESARQADASAETTNEPSERQVCRRVQQDTGTRLGSVRRVCMTAREWREHDRQN